MYSPLLCGTISPGFYSDELNVERGAKKMKFHLGSGCT